MDSMMQLLCVCSSSHGTYRYRSSFTSTRAHPEKPLNSTIQKRTEKAKRLTCHSVPSRRFVRFCVDTSIQVQCRQLLHQHVLISSITVVGILVKEHSMIDNMQQVVRTNSTSTSLSPVLLQKSTDLQCTLRCTPEPMGCQGSTCEELCHMHCTAEQACNAWLTAALKACTHQRRNWASAMHLDLPTK